MAQPFRDERTMASYARRKPKESSSMRIVTRVLGGAIAFIGALFGGALLFGRRLCSSGQAPFDAVDLEAEGSQFAVTADGRFVEYFVYGTADPEAGVVVNMHGSGLEARFEVALYQSECDDLGVRGIAISLPGYGCTDMKPGRKVLDRANEDLLAVLDREGVEEFMIRGHLQGTPHAMAAAYAHPVAVLVSGSMRRCFQRRCVMKKGFRAHWVQRAVLDSDARQAVYGLVLHRLPPGGVTFSPALPIRSLIAGGPKLKEEPEVLE